MNTSNTGKRTGDRSPGRNAKKSKSSSCTSEVPFTRSHDIIPAAEVPDEDMIPSSSACSASFSDSEDQTNQENDDTTQPNPVCRVIYMETLLNVLRIEQVSFLDNLEQIENAIKVSKEKGIIETLDARLIVLTLETALMTLLKPPNRVSAETYSVLLCSLIRILREFVEKLIDLYPLKGFKGVFNKIWEETRNNDEEADRRVSVETSVHVLTRILLPGKF